MFDVIFKNDQKGGSKPGAGKPGAPAGGSKPGSKGK